MRAHVTETKTIQLLVEIALFLRAVLHGALDKILVVKGFDGSLLGQDRHVEWRLDQVNQGHEILIPHPVAEAQSGKPVDLGEGA